MTPDPRGPIRTVAAVEKRTDITLLTYAECGHVGRHNQIFHYKVGEQSRCFLCGKEGRA